MPYNRNYTISQMIKLPTSTIPTLLLLLALVKVSQCRQFTIKNHRFYDRKGGQITFHGVNMAYSHDLNYRRNFGEEPLGKLKSWGLNGIRLRVLWSMLEPQEGHYNDTYLQYMVDYVNKAGREYGIYTLIEYHQDNFGEGLCGDGVPAWAVSKAVRQTFPLPLADPSKAGSICDQINWSDFYYTFAVNEGFEELYGNVGGLRDKFVEYWRKVAKAFKNNPYVIGYELLNEPWPGNMYKNPFVMIPGLSQNTNLQHFYDVISQAIRSVDPQQNICVQPVTWLNSFPAGFTHSPGGNTYKNRSMLCFHYYKPPVLDMDFFLYARKLDMTRLGIGGLLTEFWGVTDQTLVDMVILDKCDRMFLSWFAWEYRYDILVVWALKRTYAQRVAGVKERETYNNVTRKYQLRYKAVASAGETRIFFNYDHYLYGQSNYTDTQLTPQANKTSTFSGPIPENQLNMEITIIPETKYRIQNNMHIVIDSGLLDGRVVLVRVERREQYGLLIGRGARWAEKNRI